MDALPRPDTRVAAANAAATGKPKERICIKCHKDEGQCAGGLFDNYHLMCTTCWNETVGEFAEAHSLTHEQAQQVADAADACLVDVAPPDAGRELTEADKQRNDDDDDASGDEETNPWVDELLKMLQPAMAPKRKIYFVRGDPAKGKSDFLRKVQADYPDLVFMFTPASHRHSLSNIAANLETIKEAKRSPIVVANLGMSFWETFNKKSDADFVNTLEDLKDGFFLTSLKPVTQVNLDPYTPYLLVLCNQFPPFDVVKGLSSDKWCFLMIDPLHSRLVPYTGYDDELKKLARDRQIESMQLAAGEMARTKEVHVQAEILLKCFKPVRGTPRRKTRDLLTIANQAGFVGSVQDLGTAISKTFADYDFVKSGPSNGKAGWDGLADVA